ncbi:hypothetical protein RvY_10705 [Ramazzottius varieornatus]|uniref:Uncharacterized protein n=1 Tax=Ramazzottius varieornatus TaxID=947166 RepID=A0A1D1VDL9_RAMVA|nr:hypothetical protein RvY_10705 [Ramazzottius varieornatus]
MSYLLYRCGFVQRISRRRVVAPFGTLLQSGIPISASFHPVALLSTSPSRRAFAKKEPIKYSEVVDEEDKPIQYSSSKAFKHRVLNLEEDDIHAVISRRVIFSSLLVFMFYFFYLRDENDVDRQMKLPLWEKIPGLERQTLQALIQHKREKGMDASVEQARLRQVIKEEQEGHGASFRKFEQPPPVVKEVGPLTSRTAPEGGASR